MNRMFLKQNPEQGKKGRYWLEEHAVHPVEVEFRRCEVASCSFESQAALRFDGCRARACQTHMIRVGAARRHPRIPGLPERFTHSSSVGPAPCAPAGSARPD